MSTEAPLQSPAAGGANWYDEIRQAWRQLPNRGVLLSLLLAWTALFHFLGTSTFGYVKTHSMFRWWTWVYTRGAVTADGNGFSFWKLFDAEEWYAWFIPFIVLALLWQKRKEWLSTPKSVWWPGLALLALAAAVHVGGYLIQQERVGVAAYCLGLFALTCLVWGSGWARLAFFPFTLFIFCVPLGAGGAEVVTFPLRLLATKLTAVISQTILGINVIQDGTRLFNPTGAYQYEVAAPCGGLRSLTVIVAFSVIFGYVTFRSFWRRAAMVVAAVPLAVGANAVRLTSIILAAETFGQKAGNYVHEHWLFSLVPYVFSFVGLLAMSRWLRENRRPRRTPEPLAMEGAKQGL